MSSPSSSNPKRRLIWFGVSAGLCLLIFLVMAEFFSAWSGVAGSWRPLAGSDGEGDPVWRVALVQDGGGYGEVVLPVEALSGHDVPRSNSGVPPRQIDDDAPRVEKARFSFTLSVDGLESSTVESSDVAAPVILFVLLVLTGVAMTRSSGSGKPVGVHAGQPQAPVPPKRRSSGKGPPPTRKGRRRRR